VCAREAIRASSMLRLIRRAVALARMLPTLEFTRAVSRSKDPLKPTKSSLCICEAQPRKKHAAQGPSASAFTGWACARNLTTRSIGPIAR
jgi:hypothetical protein